MAFLCLLLVEFEVECVGLTAVEKVDFDPVGFGHAEAHFFSVHADVVIADGEAGAENGRIDAMQGRATETVLFREGGEGSGGRVGRDAKNDVVVGIDILL